MHHHGSQRVCCRRVMGYWSKGQDEAWPSHCALVTAHAVQERYCKPYISLPATGIRAIRISPDSASVM